MGINIDKTTGGDFPVLDLGMYEARLVAIDEQEAGLFGPQLVWKFETIQPGTDPDGETVEAGLSVWAWTSQTYSDYPSNAYKFAQTLLGDDFDEDAPLRDGPLVGRAARIKVDVFETKKTDTVSGETVVTLRNKVLGIFPTKLAPEDVVPSATVYEDEEIPF